MSTASLHVVGHECHMVGFGAPLHDAIRLFGTELDTHTHTHARTAPHRTASHHDQSRLVHHWVLSQSQAIHEIFHVAEVGLRFRSRAEHDTRRLAGPRRAAARVPRGVEAEWGATPSSQTGTQHRAALDCASEPGISEISTQCALMTSLGNESPRPYRDRS